MGNRLYGSLSGVERVIHRISSNRTGHANVTDKMANSNALQDCVCVCFYALTYVSVCIHGEGLLEPTHTHPHQKKNRGHTPGVSLQQ